MHGVSHWFTAHAKASDPSLAAESAYDPVARERQTSKTELARPFCRLAHGSGCLHLEGNMPWSLACFFCLSNSVTKKALRVQDHPASSWAPAASSSFQANSLNNVRLSCQVKVRAAQLLKPWDRLGQICVSSKLPPLHPCKEASV